MFDVEQAKRDVIAQRKSAWRLNWISDRKRQYAHDTHTSYRNAPEPKQIPEPPDLAPQTWFVHTWATGGIVMDAEEFFKLPKRQQDKILKTK